MRSLQPTTSWPSVPPGPDADGRRQGAEEIALIGYDDIEFAAAAVVPLSSIRQPSALIGSTALELLSGSGVEDGFDPPRWSFRPN